MAQELKPCPACGSLAQLIISVDTFVMCSARCETVANTEEEAIRKWNALPRHNEPEWLPIEQLPSEVKNTVPVGFTLIGWCEHGKDPYFLDEGKRLTTYGAHCEGLSRAADGVYAIAWGGEYSDGDELSGQQWTIPSWWFVDDGMFETPVNPTYYKLIPNPPEVTR